MKTRTTPEMIKQLDNDEVFVFGSNTGGVHAGGAARLAIQWGAKLGQGFGLAGKTFAIPTIAGKWNDGKNPSIGNILSLSKIQGFVKAFVSFAKRNPRKTFLVTAIGCGIAGFTPKQIAPLFSCALEVSNISLPEVFWEVLED